MSEIDEVKEAIHEAMRQRDALDAAVADCVTQALLLGGKLAAVDAARLQVSIAIDVIKELYNARGGGGAVA